MQLLNAAVSTFPSVADFGFQQNETEFQGRVQQVPSAAAATNVLVQPMASSSGVIVHRQATGGVRVHTPIMNNPVSTQTFPLIINVTPAEPGVNAAFQHYNELRDMLKQHVYQLDKQQTVIVKPRMMTQPHNQIKPIMVAVSIQKHC